LDGILNIITGKTVGFGWDFKYITTYKAVGLGGDFTYNNRQGSRILMRF
jgi:hypothetical protein